MLYIRDDRGLGVLLGENAAKFICEEKTDSSQNFPPSSKQNKTYFSREYFILRIAETVFKGI